MSRTKKVLHLEKAVFRVEHDLPNNESFAFYGNDLEEYPRLAGLSHSDFDRTDLEKSFLEVDKKRATLLSVEERDNWIRANVALAVVRFELIFSTYDQDLIERLVETVFNESNGQIELRIQELKIEAVRKVSATAEVSYFPPQSVERISGHVRSAGKEIVDRSFEIVVVQ